MTNDFTSRPEGYIKLLKRLKERILSAQVERHLR